MTVESRSLPLGYIKALTLFLLVLTGCASLPDSFEQQPSRVWSEPGKTSLGALIAETAPDDTRLSGVELLSDPEEALRTRLAIAIHAEKTLDMQYYLWKGDLSGRLLLHQVLKAADRGVTVRFLIDDIYHSGRDRTYALLNAHPHMQVRVFNPMANRGIAKNLNYVRNKQRLNHRMHNKIFMADGAVAVLGGRNIGDDYFGINTKANFFDLDVLTVGRAAIEAGYAFDEYWNSRYAVPIEVLHKSNFSESEVSEARAELEAALHDPSATPYATTLSSGQTRQNLVTWRDQLIWTEASVVVDALERFQGQGTSAIGEYTADTIENMDDYMMLESAYLIPSEQGLKRISDMIERGLKVRILTNSLVSNNHLSAHSGYMKYRKAILRTGAELHELRPDAALREHFKASEDNDEVHAGIHTKAFVIDGNQALIGSFNFDPRSRDLNSEIGLVVSNKEFTMQVEQVMNRDFDPDNSYRVYLNEQGKLRWEEHTQDGIVIHHHDPGASIWQRMGARILSWLPIEKEL